MRVWDKITVLTETHSLHPKGAMNLRSMYSLEKKEKRV